MQELITITEQKGIQLVNARELHRKLKTGRDFSNWIKGRIKEYGFLENEDYFTENHRSPILASQEIAKGGFNKIDYFISLNMAKELAMVEKNEMGRKIRRYFIEMEKVARQNILQLPAPKTINGVKCVHYISWILANNYSPMSGQVRARIKKYPEQFIKLSAGWYMSEAIGQYFLDYKNPKERVEALPFVSPKQLKLFN